MSLMLCLGAFCVRFQKLNTVTCILGYLLSMLGILWNTESGMFCTVAWTAFGSSSSYAAQNGIFKNTENVHRSCCFCNSLFFGAYGMVNAYNLLCGGSVNSIQEFLFPLLTTSYMDGFLRVDLPDYPSAYVPVLILLFLAVAWGLSYMSCFGRKILSGKTEILMPCFSFFTGVLALGQMSYFMNRAAYHNLDICHLPAVLLMCILAERGMDFVRQFRFKSTANTHLPNCSRAHLRL